MNRLVTALTFAILACSPAFAQTTQRAPAAQAVKPFVPPGLFGVYAQSPPSTTVSRETAIGQCSAEMRSYPQLTWGHQEIDRYRTCMARMGHME
jgi:hypothetical protein